MQRSLEDLVDDDDPAMTEIAAWSAESARDVEIVPVDPERGAANLLALQITTRSSLGAIAYETGGVLIDGGWLRLLGAGSPRLPRSLASWNRLDGEHRLPGALLVADDVCGGFFAINGAGLEAPVGNVCYFAPDTCVWEDLEVGYSDWLRWALAGDIDSFYQGARWPGWRDAIAELGGDRGMLIYPPPWSAGAPLADRSRRSVPIEELWEIMTIEYATLLGAAATADDM